VVLDPSRFAEWCEARGRQLASLDFGPPLRRSAIILVSYARQSFDGAHDPDGRPWAPLQRPRRRGRSGEKPLRDTGLLMASLTAGSGAAGHVERLSPHELVWGTNIEYAGFHQDGTRHVPARPFLGINNECASDIAQSFAEYVAAQVI
jgi:phage gpG-like protein